jgi:multiple sugar transport system permease protein
MLAYVIITGFIGGFKEYSSVVGIFGDPLPDTLNTMVGLVYKSLELNQQGRASAAALILFAIILVVTWFNNNVIQKHVHY